MSKLPLEYGMKKALKIYGMRLLVILIIASLNVLGVLFYINI